jgi:hypothetical protein
VFIFIQTVGWIFSNPETIISILGLAVNIFIAVFVWEYTDIQNKANNWLAVNQHIADAEKNELEMGFRYHQLEIETIINEKYKGHEYDTLSLIYKDYRISIMNKLNAFEVACTMYFEEKLDKKSFFEDRKYEIEDLVENKGYSEWFGESKTGFYKNIRRFYNEEIKSKN